MIVHDRTIHLRPATISVEETIDRLRATYGLPSSTALLQQDLRDLEAAFGGLDNVHGKRILDLGCGARRGTCETDSCRDFRTFEPWFCRAVHKLGGIAVGIDIGVNNGEPFEIHSVNLRDPSQLSRLFESGSFDGISCRLFLSSPELCRRTSREERLSIRSELHAQAERLLKPDGAIIRFDDDVEAP